MVRGGRRGVTWWFRPPRRSDSSATPQVVKTEARRWPRSEDDGYPMLAARRGLVDLSTTLHEAAAPAGSIGRGRSRSRRSRSIAIPERTTGPRTPVGRRSRPHAHVLAAGGGRTGHLPVAADRDAQRGRRIRDAGEPILAGRREVVVPGRPSFAGQVPLLRAPEGIPRRERSSTPHRRWPSLTRRPGSWLRLSIAVINDLLCPTTSQASSSYPRHDNLREGPGVTRMWREVGRVLRGGWLKRSGLAVACVLGAGFLPTVTAASAGASCSSDPYQDSRTQFDQTFYFDNSQHWVEIQLRYSPICWAGSRFSPQS